MSFSFGVIGWEEIFALEDVFASIRRQVAEFAWTWPSGEPPDWDAIQAGQLPPPDTGDIPIPNYPAKTAIPTDTRSFSGPGMAYAASFESARSQFWDQDDWTSHHLLLPFIAPGPFSTHGWNVITPPTAGRREVHWSLWDGEQTSWMWQYALAEATRRRVTAVITRESWPTEDLAVDHLWFLGFFPHLGRALLRAHLPGIM